MTQKRGKSRVIRDTPGIVGRVIGRGGNSNSSNYGKHRK